MPIATSGEHGSLTQLTSPIGVTLEKKDAAGQSQRTGVLRLFRREALDHYYNADSETEAQVLRVSPPWTWALFLAFAVIIAAAVAISFIAEVDITSRGRGVMRAPGGVRVLQTQVGGVVAEVKAKSGQSVDSGQPLLRLESASLEGALLEADRKLVQMRSNLTAFVARQETLYRQRSELLTKRAGILHEREESLDATIERLNKRAQSYDILGQKGIVGSMALDDAAEQLAQAERLRLATREELSQAKLELASLESGRQSDRFRWEQEVQDAETKRNALAFSLNQTSINAPQAGYLEAVLVRPGDVVQPGGAVGRLVAGGAPSKIIAFLPERDRAFVTPGAEIRVEVEQLPYAEFGTLKGRVDRVATDLAARYEVTEALGEEAQYPGPSYRVELSLLEDDRAKQLSSKLRAGMLVNARFTLRRRRLISLVLDPLRRWLR